MFFKQCHISRIEILCWMKVGDEIGTSHTSMYLSEDRHRTFKYVSSVKRSMSNICRWEMEQFS